MHKTLQGEPQFDPPRIPTHVHVNPNCDELIPYLEAGSHV